MIKTYLFLILNLSFTLAFHSLIDQGCTSDSQCVSDGWEQCIIKDGAKSGTCKHKGVFPMKLGDFTGMMLVLAVLWQSGVGGVGGCGMVLPISMICFRFDAKNAISLSNFSIFLSGFIRYFLNANKPHPLKNGKGLLVDINLCLLMLPGIVSGVSVGVIMNTIVPNLIICVCFIALTAYMT